MILICIRQHLSNIWRLIHEKLSNTETELKKSVAYKKSGNTLDVAWSHIQPKQQGNKISVGIGWNLKRDVKNVGDIFIKLVV